jgi:hypothetical protein
MVESARPSRRGYGPTFNSQLATLAIESGCEWVLTDRDFARFKGLRWRHPLENSYQVF